MSTVIAHRIFKGWSTFIAFWIGLLSGWLHAEEPLPKGWRADLQPAFKVLQRAGESGSQQTADLLSGQLTELRDIELALTYLDLWIRLSAKEQDQLKAEQAKWMAGRTKRAGEAAKGEEGGSTAVVTGNLAALKITETRLAGLRKRLAAAAEAAPSKRTEAPLPKDWRPSLQGAIDWLEDDSGDGPVTAILHNRERQLDIRNAELALTYRELWIQVTAPERATLKTEQTAWLATRSKEAAAAAKKQTEETLAALESARTGTELTQKRAAELRERLAKLSGEKPKP